MIENAKSLYAITKTAYADIYTQLRNATSEITRIDAIGEWCDLMHSLNQSAKLLEDIAIEMRKKRSLCETMICQKVVRDEIYERIETDYVYATPKPKIGVSLPGYKKDRPAFDAMMIALNVPESLWKGLERPIARLDYPAVTEQISELTERGLPIPLAFEGFKKNNLFTVSLYSRKEVDE